MRNFPQQAISVILCVILFPHLTGCHVKASRGPETFTSAAASKRYSDVAIFGVTTVDDRKIGFDQERGSSVQRDTLFAYVEGAPFAIPFAEIEAVWIREPSGGHGLVSVPLVQERIVAVTTAAGQEINFDKEPKALIRSDTLRAHVQGEPFVIALDQVKHVWISRESALRTLLVFGIVAAIALVVTFAIVAATKESCPFVYSWNGEQYVFDAEPYGGAVTRGLERDDYSELEHLRADNGFYRLKVTNEVNEVQYTNLVQLMVIDHSPGSRVEVDEFGHVYIFEEIEPLRSARDPWGGDLLPWLASTDRLIWEPQAFSDSTGSVREDIILTFAKPRNTTQALLIANLATGQWGSHMIRELLDLRGSALDEWYAAIDAHEIALDSLAAWNTREELYTLKLQVKEPAGWVVSGLVPGGGPFIAEDRVVPLDVSRVSGDSLQIRIRPPRGFWALNSFAVSYSSGQDFRVQKVTPQAAQISDGRDILSELVTNDEQYYAMPNTGDHGYVSFLAPPTRPGMTRTVFLHTRGYYRLNLEGVGAPDLATLHKVAYVPDAAARLAADLFTKHLLARRANR